MCSIDLDPCDVWRETERKARKPHACDSCGGKIAVGEVYVSHFSVFDRYPAYEAMCLPCRDARGAFLDDHGTAPTPSAFREVLAECIGDGDPESIIKWRPMLAAMDLRGEAARKVEG